MQCLPAQSCLQAVHYRFPCHGYFHLGPTCRCPLFPQIRQLSARVSPAAPIPAAAVLRPITWSLLSLAANCCLTYACCWVILTPRSLRRRHDIGAKHPTIRPRTTSLLPPPLLAPRATPSSLQLPSPAPRRHHVLARPCASSGHHQPLHV
jgi:hypothetical protein